ncbi:TIGR01777 family oxidoreductase [Demequina lutea]|uniref:TIGR01777 family protein n=1 Tax=Demequina lutea TaxID=431489 RepID=A0A7Z0CJS3_9MICO|nr:TIGR01777 family oxidoreductase [Demequina lutea]NYI41188.1 hypothetical protein [Demequina lutea]
MIVSGSHGLIGTALGESLRADGHTVVALVRRDARGEHESSWDPTTGRIDDAAIAAADVVVNLAGASIGDKRLTVGYQKVVLSSRVDSTSTIANAIARANPTAALLQGSSMGFYGDRGTDPLTERLPAGDGFLADVSRQWEASAAPAVNAGARVVYLRTGLVLAPHGGFAKRLLPLAGRGLIGALGHAEALQSWISLVDEVRAMRFLIDSAHRGPVNLVAPGTVSSAEFVSAISEAHGHHSGIPVPSWVLQAVVGPAADDLLASQNGVPGVLNRLGFQWTHSTIAEAAKYIAQP